MRHTFIISQSILAKKKERSIVAGLVKHYSPEDLTDRKVFVLANLKASELRSILSEGMVLVCEKRNKMELLNASAFSTGDQITVEDQTIDHTEISIDQFKTAPLRIVSIANCSSTISSAGSTVHL